MIITSNPTHSSFSRVSDVLNGEALSDTLGKLDSAPRAQGPPLIRGIPLLRRVRSRVQLTHSNKITSPHRAHVYYYVW